MKRNIWLLGIVLFTVLLGGCSSPADKLEKSVEAENAQCPIGIGMIGSMTSIKYDKAENNVLINFLIKSDVVPLKEIKNADIMFSKIMKAGLSGSDKKEVIQMVREAGASMTIRFVDDQNPALTTEIKFSSDDINEIAESNLSDEEINSIILENQIAIDNSHCPMTIDEGLKIISVAEEDSNVVYTCQLDEDFNDIKLFEPLKEELRANMKENFSDPTMKEFLSLLVALNKGFVFRFVGDKSGTTIDISYTPEELKEYI